MRIVSSLPAALPAIDFASYGKVTVPGMVDNFEAKYAALTIPYPSDQGSLAAIDAQGVEQKAAAAAFCADSAARIVDIKVELSKWEAMQPIETMNREEALDAGLLGTSIIGLVNPDVPSFWPHDEVCYRTQSSARKPIFVLFQTWEAYVERLKEMPEEEAH